MDRVAVITERFNRHFEHVGATPLVLSRTEWADVEPRDNLRVVLGFRRPELPDGVARFCPELVAEQTAHLSDEDFHDYLNSIQWVIDHEIQLIDMDLGEASHLADIALMNEGPGSLRLLTEVHLRWLDRLGKR